MLRVRPIYCLVDLAFFSCTVRHIASYRIDELSVGLKRLELFKVVEANFVHELNQLVEWLAFERRF